MQEKEKDLQEKGVVFLLQQSISSMPCESLPTEDAQNTLFGKTLQEPSQAIKGWTLRPCLKKSQKPVFQFLDTTSGQNQGWLEAESVQSHGEHWTPSIGEFPKDDVESSLSQIIQTGGGTEEILFKPEMLSRHLNKSKEAQYQAERNSGGCIEETSKFALNDQGGARMDETVGYTNVLRSSANHPPIVFDMAHACDVIRTNIGVCQTLQHRMGTGGNQIPLTYDNGKDKLVLYQKDGKIGSLMARDYKGVGNDYVTQGKIIISDLKLRKLTPLECERLQGLPDNWTLIDDKTCSDSARYKAIGNGMAQPCADFVMKGIAEHEELKLSKE